MKQCEFYRQVRCVLLVVLMFFWAASIANGMSGSYTYNMFRIGLDEESAVTSAPHFILIRLGEGYHESRVICLPSSFLENAIHSEYKIPYTIRGVERARNIAKSNWNKVFVFRNREACKNVQPRYDARTLESAREQVAKVAASTNSLSKHQIVTLEKSIDDRINKNEDTESVLAFRDALAHALLERGILVRADGLTESLHIDSNGRKN